MRKKGINKRSNNKKIVLLIVIFLVGVFMAVLVHPLLGILIAITPFVINAIIDTGMDIAKEEVDLSKRIKEELAPKVIKLVLPSSKYFPYEGIEQEKYEVAEYIDTVTDFKSSDKIIANMELDENRYFKIEYTEITFNKNSKEKEEFIGIFGITTLPKDIRSKIKINRLGTFEQGNIFKYNTGIKEFDSIFDIFSPNKSLANKILRESLLTEIIELYNSYGYMIEINIIRDKLYVRVESGSMLKYTENGKIIDRIIMDKHYNLLKPLTDLVMHIYKIVDEIEK